MKEHIVLTEAQLADLVETVTNNLLREYGESMKSQQLQGALAARKFKEEGNDGYNKVAHWAFKNNAKSKDPRVDRDHRKNFNDGFKNQISAQKNG